jgi:transcriptional regulator with XRE-family HTH domain
MRQFLSKTPDERHGAGRGVHWTAPQKTSQPVRARRIQRRPTQTELAKAAQSSQSRTAKMEAGDSSSWLDLLVKLLLALRASAQELGEIIASPTAASASR